MPLFRLQSRPLILRALNSHCAIPLRASQPPSPPLDRGSLARSRLTDKSRTPHPRFLIRIAEALNGVA
jgi:hypothetical protein